MPSSRDLQQSRLRLSASRPVARWPVGGRSLGPCRAEFRGAGGAERVSRGSDWTIWRDLRPRAATRSLGRASGARGRAASSGQADRQRLDVPAADGRLAALVTVRSEHLAGRVQQHLTRLLDGSPARNDRRPLGQLSHRPAVLIRREYGGQRQRLTHAREVCTSQRSRLADRRRECRIARGPTAQASAADTRQEQRDAAHAEWLRARSRTASGAGRGVPATAGELLTEALVQALAGRLGSLVLG